MSKKEACLDLEAMVIFEGLFELVLHIGTLHALSFTTYDEFTNVD